MTQREPSASINGWLRDIFGCVVRSFFDCFQSGSGRAAGGSLALIASASLCSLAVCGCGEQSVPERPQLEMAEIEVAPVQSRSDDDERMPHEIETERPQERSEPNSERGDTVAPVGSFRLPEPIEIPPRAVLDAARLHLIETETVTIVTDLPLEKIKPLTQFVDAVWPNLKTVFGPPRSDVPVDVRPLTAFVVDDVDSFAQAGVLPRTLSTKIHGQHRGWQFWMRWPSSPYYQKHLFSHEAAHCYSMITAAAGSGSHSRLGEPLASGWLESIAEWFATHSESDTGFQFGAFPESSSAVAGWGRIELLKEDLASGRRFSAVQVAEMQADRFQGVPTAYAWAWALSALLDATNHEKFRSLLAQTTRGTCLQSDVRDLCERLDRSGVWNWWLESIEYGVDAKLAMPRIVPKDSTIFAKFGWQSTGEILAPGETALIKAGGQVVLGETGRPWISTADGIRLDYADGHPIGRLMVRTMKDGRWSLPVAVGSEGTCRSADGGYLFFRVNDHWNSLDDNRGDFLITTSPTER